MLARIDSPASAEPEIQATLRDYAGWLALAAMPASKRNEAMPRLMRREMARIVRELAALGLNCN